MKFCIVGAGYVGLSLAVMLSKDNEVCVVDVVDEKVRLINERKSPIRDEWIEKYLSEYELNLTAVTELKAGVPHADFCIVATPTNFDGEAGAMDVTSVDSVIDGILEIDGGANIVIKSTVPVGYTDSVRKRKDYDNIFFSPEFLRETKALYDNLYPTRIIFGAGNGEAQRKAAERFVSALIGASQLKSVEYRIMRPAEAEAVKLFANSYLAMRVAFFNELDTFAAVGGLDPKMIIEGVCLDKRIGMHYNNPSFGYGGYCFPKDTKQLLCEYGGIRQNLIGAIVESNRTRKNFVVEQVDSILKKKRKAKKSVVGIYRLIMKSDSDNFRNSAVIDVMNGLKEKGYDIRIYDPILEGGDSFMGNKVVSDLKAFKAEADIILANRVDCNLADSADKVYTRDCYNRD
ncbi:MAG: nucleotide sugar dehydrogenase [Clostridiales bacterium]|nr:nucleotide sugar dehydrogenase [Clostridiales bacterium]